MSARITCSRRWCLTGSWPWPSPGTPWRPSVDDPDRGWWPSALMLGVAALIHPSFGLQLGLVIRRNLGSLGSSAGIGRASLRGRASWRSPRSGFASSRACSTTSRRGGRSSRPAAGGLPDPGHRAAESSAHAAPPLADAPVAGLRRLPHAGRAGVAVLDGGTRSIGDDGNMTSVM